MSTPTFITPAFVLGPVQKGDVYTSLFKKGSFISSLFNTTLYNILCVLWCSPPPLFTLHLRKLMCMRITGLACKKCIDDRPTFTYKTCREALQLKITSSLNDKIQEQCYQNNLFKIKWWLFNLADFLQLAKFRNFLCME